MYHRLNMWNSHIAAENPRSDIPPPLGPGRAALGAPAEQSISTSATPPNHPVPFSQPTPYVVFHTKISTSASETLPRTQAFLIHTEVCRTSHGGKKPLFKTVKSTASETRARFGFVT